MGRKMSVEIFVGRFERMRLALGFGCGGWEERSLESDFLSIVTQTVGIETRRSRPLISEIKNIEPKERKERRLRLSQPAEQNGGGEKGLGRQQCCELLIWMRQRAKPSPSRWQQRRQRNNNHSLYSD